MPPCTLKAHFTQGVKAKVQLKSSISIGQKLKSAPNGFTLRAKVEILKSFQSRPSYE
jgi:hypothetical protein